MLQHMNTTFISSSVRCSGRVSCSCPSMCPPAESNRADVTGITDPAVAVPVQTETSRERGVTPTTGRDEGRVSDGRGPREPLGVGLVASVRPAQPACLAQSAQPCVVKYLSPGLMTTVVGPSAAWLVMTSCVSSSPLSLAQ